MLQCLQHLWGSRGGGGGPQWNQFSTDTDISTQVLAGKVTSTHYSARVWLCPGTLVQVIPKMAAHEYP